MKAYSQDLRQRVLRAIDQGMERSEVVKTFDVSLATLKRYLKQRRETGEVRTKPIPGRPAKKGNALDEGLREQLQAYPDATLHEHCQRWKAGHGMQVSSATMSRAMQRLGWPRKKRPSRPVNGTKQPELLGASKPAS